MSEITETAEYLGSVRIIIDRLRREISCLYIPLDPSWEYCLIGKKGGSDDVPRDSLDFLSLAHQWRGGEHESRDLAEIGYRIEEEINSDSNDFNTVHRLVRRCDPWPDSRITHGGDEYEMADFIHAMRIRYYNGAQWVENWDSKVNKGLPDRVRIELIPEEKTGLNRVFSIVIPVRIKNRGNTGKPSAPGGGVKAG